MARCKYEYCQEGHYLYDYHPAEYVSRDMATDAGDKNLEDSLYRAEEFEWGVCPCCEGNYKNCLNCSKEKL